MIALVIEEVTLLGANRIRLDTLLRPVPHAPMLTSRGQA